MGRVVVVAAFPQIARSGGDARAIVAAFESPSAVPITNPRTSPIAQPIKQWIVASEAIGAPEIAV